MAESAFEQIRDIVVEQLEVSPEAVKPEAHFFDDLDADSLDVVELTMRLEEDFGIEIPDEEAEKLQTVQDAVTYVDAHRG